MVSGDGDAKYISGSWDMTGHGLPLLSSTVLAVHTGCGLETDFSAVDLSAQAVEGLEALLPVLIGVFWLDEYVAGVEHIPLLVQYFNDMESSI